MGLQTKLAVNTDSKTQNINIYNKMYNLLFYPHLQEYGLYTYENVTIMVCSFMPLFRWKPVCPILRLNITLNIFI